MTSTLTADTPRPPRRRDREASRRALIDAGIELFSELGYEAATTKAIATLAGLNEQLITRYFGGKAGLLAAVYLDFIASRDNDTLYAAEPIFETAAAEIRHFMLFKHQHIADVGKLLRIVMPQMIIDPSLLPLLDDPNLLRGGRILSDRLGAMKTTGVVHSSVDTKRVASIVISQSIALSFLMRHMSRGRDDEVLRLIDMFSAFLGASLCQDRDSPFGARG